MRTYPWSQLLLFPIALAAWCAPTAGRAQTTRSDSLKALTAHKTDTIRIDALISLGRELRKKDPDQALVVQTQAKEQAAATGHTDRQAKALNDMGISYGMKEDYASSMEHFKQSLQLHSVRGNQIGVADGYNNLAIVYKHIGDYSQSLNAHLKALEIYDALGNQSGRAASLLNIGVAYDLMKEPKKAIEYFEQALEIKEKINDEEGKALVLHNMGLMYETQKQYEKALTYLFEHLVILEKTDNQVALANSLNSVGKVYLSIGDYKNAAIYLNQSREKATKLGLKQPLIHALHNLAKIHIGQGEPNRAIPLLEEHNRLADELKSFLLKRQGHDLLATAYEQTNDYKSALKQAQLAAASQDSLFNTERTQAYQQWQARLEVYEKDRQLDQQTQELHLLEARARTESQLRWALVVAFLLSIFSAFLFYQKYRIRQQTNEVLLQKNQLIETQKAEIETTSKELERRMLRAQINPHFIFNALGSIQHFITANDRASALKYLSKFSSLLRQVLEDSITNIVVLEEEIKLLKIYLELEALRFDGGFNYQIEIDPDLDPHTTEVPLLLIQPFVENAILHGLMPKSGERQLHISFAVEGNFTVCRITDNGIGRKAAAELKAQKAGSQPSRGMEVTRKRLEALNKNSAAQTLVSFNDRFQADGSAAGTEVVIQIPTA